MPSPLSSLAIFLLLFLTSPTSAWKKDEFRTCNQTPFCKRARTRSLHSLPAISAAHVSLTDGKITAHLTRQSDPNSESETRPLLLELSVFQDGILRLKIDEDYSTSPPSSSGMGPAFGGPSSFASEAFICFAGDGGGNGRRKNLLGVDLAGDGATPAGSGLIPPSPLPPWGHGLGHADPDPFGGGVEVGGRRRWRYWRRKEVALLEEDRS